MLGLAGSVSCWLAVSLVYISVVPKCAVCLLAAVTMQIYTVSQKKVTHCTLVHIFAKY